MNRVINNRRASKAKKDIYFREYFDSELSHFKRRVGVDLHAQSHALPSLSAVSISHGVAFVNTKTLTGRKTTLTGRKTGSFMSKRAGYR